MLGHREEFWELQEDGWVSQEEQWELWEVGWEPQEEEGGPQEV